MRRRFDPKLMPSKWCLQAPAAGPKPDSVFCPEKRVATYLLPCTSDQRGTKVDFSNAFTLSVHFVDTWPGNNTDICHIFWMERFLPVH